MERYSRFIGFMIALLCGFAGYSQVEMADNFRGEGKIYIVVGVILIILVGFFYLLWKLDTRTKKLEKEVKGDED